MQIIEWKDVIIHLDIDKDNHYLLNGFFKKSEVEALRYEFEEVILNHKNLHI